MDTQNKKENVEKERYHTLLDRINGKVILQFITILIVIAVHIVIIVYVVRIDDRVQIMEERGMLQQQQQMLNQ